MFDIKIITAIIGSSVLAALITAIFSRIQHSRQITVRYVTEEREKWRENLKVAMSELSEYVNSSDDNEKTKKIRSKATYIKLCLNPDPKHSSDSDVLKKLDEICNSPSYRNFKKLEKSMQIILKHDWERVKLETKTKHLTVLYLIAFSCFIYFGIDLYFKDTLFYKKTQSIELFSGQYTELFY
ncbi:hypothetical protein BZG78_14985, partial [Salinivibrio sp. MA351]|uniref:hypothetical protein n=1 Tax=Salinivibrio sp. MA351 TaxID=1909453 RepID=UPI0009893111